MTDSTIQPESSEPDTAPKKADPTGIEGANPALDDTGNFKAAEVGESPEPPENLENLDLTPAGLANESAEQEDTDTLVDPENTD